MANSFWNFVLQLVPGTLARAEDVNANLSGINTGFDTVEQEISKAIRVTVDPGTTELPLTVGARANMVLAFDNNGDIIASNTIGVWKYDHADAAGTDYQARDMVRDAQGRIGQDNIFICNTTHTSTGTILDDAANWDLLIDVADVYAAETGAVNAQAAAEAAQAAAELALDEFTDLYLGAKTSEPSLDNDGNPLQDGAMFFHTSTVNRLKVYNGSTWQLATASAVDVSVSDSGGYFAGTEVESVLQEVGFSLGGVRKNAFINGDHAICQDPQIFGGHAYTSQSAFFYGADRFWFYSHFGGTPGVTTRVTITENTDVPTLAQVGQVLGRSINMQCTSAFTPSTSSHEADYGQHIEGPIYQNMIYGHKMQLSFWTKSNKAATYALLVRSYGSPLRYFYHSITVSGSQVWEKHTVTIPHDTGVTTPEFSVGLKGYGVVLILNTGSSAGAPTMDAWTSTTGKITGQSNFLDSTANWIRTTAWQLEPGEAVTPLERTFYAHELTLCQRYDWFITNEYNQYARFGNGMMLNATNGDTWVDYPVQMCEEPIIQRSSFSHWLLFTPNSGNTAMLSLTPTSFNIVDSNPQGCYVRAAVAGGSGATLGYPCSLYVPNILWSTTKAWIRLRAEI